MKHVLLVVAKSIYPPLSGGELRIYSLLRALSDHYRFSILMLLPGEENAADAAAALYLESALVQKVHLVRRGAVPVPRPSRLTPDHAYWLSDPRMAEALKKIIVEENIDLVHFESSSLGQYASGIRGLAPVVLTEHDAGILSWRTYHRPTSRPWSWRTGLDWIARLAYHRKILAHCDRVVALSAADARRLGRFTASEKISVVPTGVDLEHFAFQKEEARRPGEILYVGHYPHYPNEDAAVFLCRDILHRVRARHTRARVRLVGSRPTPAVERLKSETVEVVGTVADVRPYLGESSVFLAPLRLGHGIKGKLLEAFACGLPVVTTPQACEAMPGLRHERHLLMAGSAAALAENTARVLADAALGSRLAREARAYVERHFGWPAQAALLDGVYQGALR